VDTVDPAGALAVDEHAPNTLAPAPNATKRSKVRRLCQIGEVIGRHPPRRTLYAIAFWKQRTRHAPRLI
jgi:hypothetical protein